MKFFSILFAIFLTFQILLVDAEVGIEVDEISEMHGVKHHNKSELFAKNIADDVLEFAFVKPMEYFTDYIGMPAFKVCTYF